MLGLGNILTKGGALLGFPNKYSFNFDGSNDNLEITDGDIPSGDESRTISAWINADVLSGDQGLVFTGTFNTNQQFTLAFLSSNANKLSVWGYSNDFTGTTTLSTGTWYHVVAVYDSSASNLKTYINGTVDINTTVSTNFNTTFGKTIIGARDGGSYFNGKIDEVAIWDTALDASTIAKLGSKPLDLTKYSASNLKLWLRSGDAVLPEEDKSIARSDFYTDFDGTNDVVTTPSIDLGTTHSVSCWVKTSTGSKVVIGIDISNFLIYINTNFQIQYDATGTPVTSADALISGAWNHVAVTRSGTTVNYYINGKVDSGGADTINANDALSGVFGLGGVSSFYLLGQLSNVALYKTTLDAQTIKQFAKSRYTPMRDNRFSVVDFDGTDDFIDTGTGLPDITSGAFTISGWFNFDSVSATHWLWGRGTGSGSGYAIKFDTTPRLIAQSKTSSSYQYYASNYTFSVGEWYHITFVHSGTGTTPKLYINGALNAGSGAWNSDIVSQSSLSFKIGSNEGTSNEFNGQIANVAWYSEAKDAEFVYAQYQKGITHNPSADTALEGLWRMGDDTSKAYPTIADSSSNSNDGTMTSMASDDIVQQMVAGYDMGAFESTEEVNGELNPNPTFSNFTGNVPDGWGVVGDDDSGNNISQGSAGGLRLQSDGGSIFAHLADVNVVGKTYHFSITITNVNDDDFSFKTLNTKFFNGDGKSAGTYTGTYVAEATYVRIFRDDSCDVEITAFSIKEEIQSADLSDTFPAIIDVNEPVLGAELFTNGWTNDGNGSSYPPYSGSFSYDASANTVTATSGSSGTYVTNETFRTEFTAVANAFYKITFTTANTNPTIQIRGLSSVNHLDTGTSTPYLSLTYSLSVDGEQVFYVKANASATRYIGFRSGGNNRSITVSNFSIKQVSGNVGLMTNQATSDLVYSSVLPDQSFLTGVNSAYNFIDLDGADQYIDCGDGTSLDTTSQLTLSSWVNFDSTGTNVILARDDNTNSNYILYGWSDGKIYAQIQISGVGKTVDGGSYSSDTWYHVVVTFDGSSLKIYVDADLKDTLSASGSIDNDDVSLEIGRKGNNAFHFDGQIGQTAIWNKSLSSTEVGAIYNLGRHGNLLDSYSDNLVGNWAMSSLDSATGLSDSISTVYDRSGNSNHGTPTNADAGDLKSPPNAEPNGYAKGDTNRSTTTP